MSKPKMFVREATGLVRAFSLTDAVAINIGSYVIMNILLWGVVSALYGFPGYDFNLMFLLVTILSVFWGLTYGLFGAVMPRAGGDYTYVSRTLHPALGFANNFAFTILALTALWGIGGTVYQGMTFGLSAYFDMMGRITSNPSLTALSSQMTAGPLGFALATIFVLIVVGINMTSKRVTSLFIKIVFIISMLNYIAPYVGFLTTSHEQYVNLFNVFTSKYYGGVTYQGIIDLARQNGWSPGTYSVTNSILALPVGFLGYLGFTYIASAGGELKRPDKNIAYSIILALFIGFIVSVIGWTMMRNVVGYDFMAAASFLSNTGKYPLPTYSATPFAFSVPIYPDPFTTSVTFLSYVVMNAFFYAVPVSIAASRNMFAWSFDRIAPQWLSNVNERFHSPINALSVTAILAIGTIALFAFASWLTVLFNILAFVMLSQVIVGLAAALFPYVRKEMFNAAPATAKVKVAGIPLLAICGAVTAVVMAISTVATLMNPITSGPMAPAAFGLGIAMYVIGFAWYYVAKWHRAKQDIDLSMIFREIPPE